MGLLNRIGVGSAEVDTILETETVEPGDSLPGRVEVDGGSDEQTVDSLELALQTHYQYHLPVEDTFSYKTKTLVERELDGFTIEPDDEFSVEVDPIEVPVHTPATISQTEVWVETRLEIDWANDPTDEDQLEVEPGPHLAALIDALEDMGFELDFADNCPAGEFGRYDEYAQFFEYENYGDGPWSYVDDLEMSVVPYGDRLDVRMDVESALGTERTTFTVDSTDPDEVETVVRREVDENT